MKRRYAKIAFAAVGLLLLIADSQKAVEGIQSGIGVCLKSVIPALLPFLILTKYLTGNLFGSRMPLLARLGKLCGVPSGLESILGVGLISGYPVGAQLIADAWADNRLDRESAERMLGFCNNAGPAFVFGVCAGLFTFKGAGWMIFTVQILSALLCGVILPGKKKTICPVMEKSSLSFPDVLNNAIRTMAGICGWVLCFRVVFSYLRYYLPIKNVLLRASVYSLLEIVNGCVVLGEIQSEPIRFVLVNGLLSFGGLCVWMQTVSVTKGLSRKWFYVGKIVQSICSIVLSWEVQFIIYKRNNGLQYGILLACISLCGVLIMKKVVAFCGRILYDKQKIWKTRYHYAVSEKN